MKEIVHKEQITNLLLNLLDIAVEDVKHSSTKEFEKNYQKRLKFQKETDWKKFRASVDLLEDTEYALISFFKYQLGYLKDEDRGDFGEVYLRLYGILNAVYLQMGAFKMLVNLLNYPNGKSISKKLETLNIYKLRNMAGSHTAAYMYDDETLKKFSDKNINRITSFRVAQVSLERTAGNILIVDENGISFEFHLLNCLYEYETIAKSLLIDIIKHSINTLVYDKVKKLEMNERLDNLLANLINYREINENKKYETQKVKEIDEFLRKI